MLDLALVSHFVDYILCLDTISLFRIQFNALYPSLKYIICIKLCLYRCISHYGNLLNPI